MQRVRLIHWNAVEAQPRIERLAALGWRVEYEARTGTGLLRRLRDEPPAAFVIDLTRLPSQGREVGVALRLSKSTRHVPLVFADGEPDKVAKIRALLPDATFTTWDRIAAALRAAIAHPPAAPIVPRDGISVPGTPLWKKLGVAANHTLGLIDPPDDFERVLGELPDGVRISVAPRAKTDLTIWFVTSARTLARRIATIAPRGEGGRLWIAWPKRGARIATDVTQDAVRATALAHRLVDYKVCAIDADWSGFKFSLKA